MYLLIKMRTRVQINWIRSKIPHFTNEIQKLSKVVQIHHGQISKPSDIKYKGPKNIPLMTGWWHQGYKSWLNRCYYHVMVLIFILDLWPHHIETSVLLMQSLKLSNIKTGWLLGNTRQCNLECTSSVMDDSLELLVREQCSSSCWVCYVHLRERYESLLLYPQLCMTYINK